MLSLRRAATPPSLTLGDNASLSVVAVPLPVMGVTHLLEQGQLPRIRWLAGRKDALVLTGGESVTWQPRRSMLTHAGGEKARASSYNIIIISPDGEGGRAFPAVPSVTDRAQVGGARALLVKVVVVNIHRETQTHLYCGCISESCCMSAGAAAEGNWPGPPRLCIIELPVLTRPECWGYFVAVYWPIPAVEMCDSCELFWLLYRFWLRRATGLCDMAACACGSRPTPFALLALARLLFWPEVVEGPMRKQSGRRGLSWQSAARDACLLLTL